MDRGIKPRILDFSSNRFSRLKWAHIFSDYNKTHLFSLDQQLGPICSSLEVLDFS